MNGRKLWKQRDQVRTFFNVQGVSSMEEEMQIDVGVMLDHPPLPKDRLS